MKEKRENWVPQFINGKYIVIDNVTKDQIYDFQGYGCTSKQKCWNWIHNQQQGGIETKPTKSIPAINPLF